MLKAPKNRNLTPGAITTEQRNLDLLNEALEGVKLTKAEEQSLLWLAGWEKSTVLHVISAFKKANKRDDDDLPF